MFAEPPVKVFLAATIAKKSGYKNSSAFQAWVREQAGVGRDSHEQIWLSEQWLQPRQSNPTAQFALSFSANAVIFSRIQK
jgi:hypothetical protein